MQGRWERGREQNERERVVGKAAGDECVFIPGEGPSWQMKSSDTIPEAAGGEGGHGVARPEGVIHRYRVYHNNAINPRISLVVCRSHIKQQIFPRSYRHLDRACQTGPSNVNERKDTHLSTGMHKDRYRVHLGSGNELVLVL